MDDETAEQIARNDARFRAVNEDISAYAAELDAGDRVPLLCECADPRCTTIVRMSLKEYEAIRAEPTHFLNAPGHQAQDAGRVVEERDEYVVIEKIGRAGEVARDLDTRCGQG